MSVHINAIVPLKGIFSECKIAFLDRNTHIQFEVLLLELHNDLHIFLFQGSIAFSHKFLLLSCLLKTEFNAVVPPKSLRTEIFVTLEVALQQF